MDQLPLVGVKALVGDAHIQRGGGVQAQSHQIDGVQQATAPAMSFVDVSEKDWFYNAVVYAYENGLMSGTSATTFAPQRQSSAGNLPSPLVFFLISTDFTPTPGIPVPPQQLKSASSKRSSGVEPLAFTPGLTDRLHALYAQ